MSLFKLKTSFSPTLVERAPQGLGTFYLPVSDAATKLLSPYFQLKHCTDTEGLSQEARTQIFETGRDKNLISDSMAKKLIVHQIYDIQPSNDFANSHIVVYEDSTGVIEFSQDSLVYLSGITNAQAFRSAAETAALSIVNTSGYSMSGSDILWLTSDASPDGLKNAPQAAIASAPADAVTNYNVVTTVLGTLTSAVNTANAKQNDIATKLNTLLAELRTLGLIAT